MVQMKLKSKMPLGKSYMFDNVTSYLLIGSLIILTVAVLAYTYNMTFPYAKTKAEKFTDGTAKYKVVYAYSDTCPHCVAFTPVFDQFTATQVMNSKIEILKVERRSANANNYLKYVDGFPTVLVFDTNGKLIDTQVGKTTLTELQTFVQKATQ